MLLDELKGFKAIDEFEQKELEVIKEFYQNNDDCLTRENQIAHFTASAWVLNETLDKVLLAYHNIYNSWAWLGGHVDGRDDCKFVAIKELKEETGINEFTLLSNHCLSVEILPVQAHIKRGKPITNHLHMNVTYAFIAKENQVLKNKPDENSKVAWIKLDQLDELVNEKHMLPIYHKLIKKVALIKNK